MKRIAALSIASLPAAAMAAGTFALESAEIKPGAKIAEAQVFNGFGCEGSNVSPSLKWSNAPPGTKSFAVTVYDPDAPTGSGWWHWVTFNIPPNVTSLPAGSGDPSAGKARCSRGPTSASRATAAPARPRATSRIATSSPSARSRSTSSMPTPMRAERWSGSCPTPTRRGKADFTAKYARK